MACIMVTNQGNNTIFYDLDESSVADLVKWKHFSPYNPF